MDFLRLIIDFTLVIVYDSFVCLIFVFLIFYIFKIKDTNIKILFFFLPLIKPFLVVSENFNLNEDFIDKRIGILGLRFITPNTFFKRLDSLESSPINYSNINDIVILTIIISILAVLIIRWINLYFFYKKLANGEIVTSREVPYLYSTIDKYSKKMGIKNPIICLSHKKLNSPFVIGIINPVIVLSPSLIEKLNKNETDILLLHELAHIKRKDNLLGWIALILKDLQFFNPFAYISYCLIKIEQEKASDIITSTFLNYKKKSIARDVINLVMKIKNINPVSNPESLSNLIYHYTPFKKINYTIFNLRIKSILSIDKKKLTLVTPLKVLLFLLFLLLLFTQVLFFININNSLILLR